MSVDSALQPTTRLRHALVAVVRRAALSRGWSGRRLGEEANLGHATACRLLRGESATLETVEAALRALGVEEQVVAALYTTSRIGAP